MTNITTEILLSVAIIVLTVFAIAVFIIYGSGTLFYGLFVIAALLMLFTWYRLSRAPPEQVEKKMAVTSKPKAQRRRRRRR